MSDLADLTPPELADLLQEAYAADKNMPGAHLTDPIVRYDLALLLDRDEAMKMAVVDVWLESPEGLEDAMLYWFDAEFLAELALPGWEED